jgi:hypothetical protein
MYAIGGSLHFDLCQMVVCPRYLEKINQNQHFVNLDEFMRTWYLFLYDLALNLVYRHEPCILAHAHDPDPVVECCNVQFY